MGRLREALSDVPQVRLVSFTVDPEGDTLEVLSDHAARKGADEERWLFARGSEEALLRPAHGGFLLGHPEDVLLHDTRFALVEGRGRIREYRDGMSDETLIVLEADVRRLPEES